jgi:cellulose synthase/poly-beta-1,6-N-acetylglucosamine synthase-like glycosyltransferase/endo-1,4-beta-D-glucanase Y
MLLLVLLCLLSLVGVTADARPSTTSSDRYIRQLDDLSALWSFYKQIYIREGRVVSLDEQGTTTSEGQGYAMLRAVWSNDRKTFEEVWRWTQRNLQIRNDKLFAWKWKGKVLSLDAATDADTDIALALILASRRFDHPAFEQEALAILYSIWNLEILHLDDHSYVTAGNWAIYEEYPTIHVAYLAPYAYEVFATIDPQHDWRRVIERSYALLHWLYDDQHVVLPPEVVYLDKQHGRFVLTHPRTGQTAGFSYDAFPIFWRVALDAQWFGRSEAELRGKMLSFFKSEWRARGKFVDRYSLTGEPRSSFEGFPLYATVHALAWQDDPALARLLEEMKLPPLHVNAIAGKGTPYYLHNWLWFDRATELQQVRRYDEYFAFLRPFDVVGFSAHFPWELGAVTLLLFLVAQWHWVLKLAFLACGFGLCVHYLDWRLAETINWIEPGGPFISLSLWLAELYAFSTVVLLLVQVGLRKQEPSVSLPAQPVGFSPSVDLLIPIYSESCDILEKTLIGAGAVTYVNKRIYVLDDSHREEVRALAERYGATYLKGPKRHAKAGNLNHALAQTDGELVAVFDTDHIPVSTFLGETVPYFAEPRMGFVQTPHHFYNRDIFQRALGTGVRIPNEQDLFNHAIQGGRHRWGGSFFVGSGAVFRRSAIMEVNGFNLMSITEDIHTSQHLHAKGWKSAFVNKDLAVGLTAENLSSYIVQRRRWMLGCLQIFFKDNPLFCRGLALRHRLGYFASLYYFLFPLARVVFWITPLYFLLFHLHPIFSEVSVLVAYVLPFMLVLPMVTSTLLPGWPRLFWSSTYEATVAFPLFRSMFDLFLPKRLGFKVTPKGLLSHRRSFDWRSSLSLLVVTVITVGAIVKGLWEFWFFGIEKDAYFFNLSWAGFNLITLLVGLSMAWERPQRRGEERILKPIRFEARGPGYEITGTTQDVSLSGLSFSTNASETVPAEFDLTLHGQTPMSCRARVVYHEALPGRGIRCGAAFLAIHEEQRRWLVLNLFADPSTWHHGHRDRVRNPLLMAGHLFVGLWRATRPSTNRRRQTPRRLAMRLVRIQSGRQARWAILRDQSSRGLGLIMFGDPVSIDSTWSVAQKGLSDRWGKPLYHRKRLFRVWRVGMRLSAMPVQEGAAEVEAEILSHHRKA